MTFYDKFQDVQRVLWVRGSGQLPSLKVNFFRYPERMNFDHSIFFRCARFFFHSLSSVMADNNIFDLTNELLFQQMQNSQQQDWALPPQQIYIPADVNYLDDFLSSPFSPQSTDPHDQQHSMQHAYASPMSQSQAQPQVDEHGNPIKIRKRPGRKPNPQSPAIRK